jgi:beta-glucosidase/6-phospho-beta-glucosidase/beta-galactosidase
LKDGKMGIALNIEYLQPFTDSELDRAAAQTGLEAALGWFADPLFFGELWALPSRGS